MSKYKAPPVKPYTPVEEPPVVEMVALEEKEFVSIAALASQGRDALLAAHRAHMANKPAEYVAPEPTERQKTRTELEMEAGRKASERHRLSALAALQPKPDPSDNYTVPVFRPADHVPNFDSKDPGARTLK